MLSEQFDLHGALEALGWRNLDLAAKVDAHPNTVSAWMTGKARVPGAVRAYVTLALDVKRWRDALDRRISP